MTIKKNRLWLIVLIGVVLSYFVWTLLWQGDPLTYRTVGNILSLTGSLIPSFWLWGAIQRSTSKNDKVFWRFLFLSTINYFVADSLWFYIETFIAEEMTFTGIYDIFYIASILFCFSAFIYRIYSYGNHSLLLKLIYDIAIVMTVSTTFSWYYILAPMIEQGSTSSLSLMITLFYPIIDLLLLFCVATFFFAGEHFFKRKSLYFILTGLLVLIFVDSIYLYESLQATYYTWNWLGPLFILPIMLLGYIALIEGTCDEADKAKAKASRIETVSIARTVTPYLLVIFLFVFMIVRSSGPNAISIGSGLSIAIVMLRQFVVISDNRKLVEQYHQKTEELEISEERYKCLFEYHPDSVFSLDLEGKIESMNNAGSVLMGYDRKRLIGYPLIDFIDQSHREKIEKNFLKGKNGWINKHEFTLQNKNGETLYIDMTHIPILVRDNLVGSFGVGRNITENRLNEQKIHYYAYHDYLTGLANRRFFEEKLELEIKQTGFNSKGMAILFLDLNKFKPINDEYGHETGDKILTAVAERIKSFTGNSDLAARLGGDEFTILLKDSAAHNVLEEIQGLSILLNQPYMINGIEFHCSASIGFSHYPTHGTTPEELLNRADTAMYRVKKGDRELS